MLAPTKHSLPSTGDLIAGKYRVEDVLGRGGMGAVYRVTHHVTGKSFAVKWLLPQFEPGQETAQRFIREAQVAGRVDHPNVVEVYDIGEDRGSLFMVMTSSVPWRATHRSALLAWPTSATRSSRSASERCLT